MSNCKQNTCELYRKHLVNPNALFQRIINDKRIKKHIETVYESFWSYHIKFINGKIGDNDDTIMVEFTPLFGFQIILFPPTDYMIYPYAENQGRFIFGFKIDSLIDEIFRLCDIAKSNMLLLPSTNMNKE
jgi:hypothetical protein